MARSNIITQYMNAALPGLSEQKRLPYRPMAWEVDSVYRALNRCVFDNQLTRPEIILGQCPKYWGMCMWTTQRQRKSSWGKLGTWCTMRISDKWFSPQWFITTLAHEMVHQYQWDIDRFERYEQGFDRDIEGPHGPSFFAWREDLHHWGVPLKTAHRMKKWFKYQDLWRT